jgi:superfamily I DNA/RNA helicase
MTVELNKEQKDVVEHKDGPVLILAGPHLITVITL